MKKILSLALCCAIAIACFTGCSAKEKLAITAENDTIKVGATLQLEVNKENVEFATSDEAVVTVDETGLITAVAEGEAKISATLKKEIAEITIKVEAADIEDVITEEPVVDEVLGEEGPEKEDAGAGEQESEVTPAPEASSTVTPAPEVQEPAKTPEPTSTPKPTATPKPTEKPAPTATPKPTEKPVEPAKTPEPAHTHTWSNATCTQPQKCSCGTTQGSALGHTWKDATYESPKTCTRCGATEGSAIPKPTPTVKPCPECGSTLHEDHPATHHDPCPVCGKDDHDICSAQVTPNPDCNQDDDTWA